MATAYLATKAQTGIQPRYVENGRVDVVSSYALTGAFVINDTVQICTVPAGASILSIKIDSPDMDTGGTAFTFDIGDATTADRFAAASTQLQNAGIYEALTVVGSFGYTYSAATALKFKVHAAATTAPTTGTINFVVSYTMDP